MTCKLSVYIFSVQNSDIYVVGANLHNNLHFRQIELTQNTISKRCNAFAEHGNMTLDTPFISIGHLTVKWARKTS